VRRRAKARGRSGTGRLRITPHIRTSVATRQCRRRRHCRWVNRGRWTSCCDAGARVAVRLFCVVVVFELRNHPFFGLHDRTTAVAPCALVITTGCNCAHASAHSPLWHSRHTYHPYSCQCSCIIVCWFAVLHHIVDVAHNWLVNASL
jgi:hypothetical protein